MKDIFRRKISGEYRHFKNGSYHNVKEQFVIHQDSEGTTTKAKLVKETKPKMEAELLFLSSWQGNPIGGRLIVVREGKKQGTYFRVGKNLFYTWSGKEDDPLSFPIDCPYIVTSTFLSIRNHFVTMLKHEGLEQFVRPTIWLSTGSNNIHPSTPVRLDGRLSKLDETRQGKLTKTLEEKYLIEIFTQSPFPAKKHVFWFSPQLDIITEWNFFVQNIETTYVLEKLVVEKSEN